MPVLVIPPPTSEACASEGLGILERSHRSTVRIGVAHSHRPRGPIPAEHDGFSRAKSRGPLASGGLDARLPAC